ncbi:hypothetical protein PIB30_095171 [Stylosanthes scabra]|uniref:Uncharacterized protein n=1 Tax=Stylosanthes scabra TaxID=79078 RepID=A0ABU6YV75_9FABA|nr:hypothetical protein [Stylosanthes scabra]
MTSEKGCLLFSFDGGLPTTTDGFHVRERESATTSSSSDLLQQSLLLSCHSLHPFHRFSGDFRIPSLSLEELSQGGFQLLNVLIRGDYPLLGGRLRDVFVHDVVVELGVHQTWLGGSAFVS